MNLVPRRKRFRRIESLEQRCLLAADPVLYQIKQPDELNDKPLAAEIGDLSIFLHDDGIHGQEVWASRGTTATTELIADLRPGAESSGVYDVRRVGDHVYFLRGDSESAVEIWRTDGTVSGTEMFRAYQRPAVQSLSFEGSTSGGLIVSADSSFQSFTEFLPTDGSVAVELTASFTQPWDFQLYNDEGPRILYASGSSSPTSLWVSDGTPLGTVEVTGYDYAARDISVDYFSNALALDEGFYFHFYTWDTFEPVLQHIDSEGVARNIDVPSSIQNISELVRVGDHVLMRSSGDYYSIDENFAISPFLTRQSTGTDSIIDVVAHGGVFYFLAETSTDVARLFRYHPGTFDLSEVSSAGDMTTDVFDLGKPLRQAGDWLVYYDNATPPALKAYDPVSGAVHHVGGVDRIPHPKNPLGFFDEGYGCIAMSDARVFYETRSADTHSLRLVDLTHSEGEAATLFSLTAGDLQVSDLRSAGPETVEFSVRTDTDWLKIHLDMTTGETQALTSSLINLNAGLIDRLPLFPDMTALGTSQISFQNESRIWVTDTTREGTHSYAGAGGSLPDRFPETLFDGTQAYVGSTESNTPVVGLTDSADQPFRPGTIGPVTAIEEPSLARFPGDALLYMQDGNVLRIDDGSMQGLNVVSDYRSKTITRPGSVDRNGDGPFRQRVLEVIWPFNEFYASDGTAAGTGIVDKTDDVRERANSVSPVRSYSSIQSDGNAFYMQLSTDQASRIPFVERPTQQLLQPFFPVDQPSSFSIVRRIDFDWLAYGSHDGSASGWWIFPDDEDEPRQLTLGSGGFLGAFGNRLMLSGQSPFADVQNDMFAINHDGGGRLYFSSLTDISGTAQTVHEVGRINGQIAIATETQGPNGTVQFYLWDGTEDGIERLHAVEAIANQLSRMPAWQYRVAETDEYLLLSTDTAIYRVPHSERTVSLTSSNREIRFGTDRLTVASDSMAESDQRVVGERLTIDATENTSVLEIHVESADAIPINGARILGAEGTRIRLSGDLDGNVVRYDQTSEGLSLTIKGRELEILGDDLQLYDVFDADRREILLSAPGANATFDRLAGDANVRISTAAEIGFNLFFSGTAVPLALISRAQGQTAELMASFNGASPLEFVQASPTGDAMQVLIEPDGLEYGSVDNQLSGAVVTATRGDFTLRLDARHNALHNPLRSHDVNGDNRVSSLDALEIINHMRGRPGDAALFPDVNDTQFVSALDALVVINELARIRAESERFDAIDRLHAENDGGEKDELYLRREDEAGLLF